MRPGDSGNEPVLFGKAQSGQRIVIRVFDADGNRVDREVVRAGGDAVWRIAFDQLQLNSDLEFRITIGGQERIFRFDPADFGFEPNDRDSLDEDQFSGRLNREVNGGGNGFGKVSDQFSGTLQDLLDQ